MIIKTMCILLTFSFYLMSPVVLAQNSVSESESVKNTNIEEFINQEIDVKQGKLDKGIVTKGSVQHASTPQTLAGDSPEVGKHVMANMDAGSMILSLLMVLALIIISALVLKRFNISQQGVSPLKVVTSLSLGAKERVVVIQAGEQQLLLGVTAQQVTLIERLTEPLVTQKLKSAELPKGIWSFLLAKKS